MFMKQIMIMGLLILVWSCTAPKTTIENTISGSPEPTEVIAEDKIIPADTLILLGTVHLEEACGTYVQVANEHGATKYKPVNLEDKFEVEGLRIKFRLKPLEKSLQLEDACKDFIPVYLVDVYAVR